MNKHQFSFALSASFLLALNAGFINAIGLLSLFNLAVSHVTGSLSKLGIALARGDFQRVEITGLIILAYFAGNVISGVWVNEEELGIGRRYGLVLIGQALLLVIALQLFDERYRDSMYVLAVACGLQNGMATRYSGATIRTSHMTGLVTDLGILLGERIRGKTLNAERMTLLVVLITGFLGGGVLAGFAFHYWSIQALWIPIIGTLTAGIGYGLFRKFK